MSDIEIGQKKTASSNYIDGKRLKKYRLQKDFSSITEARLLF